LVIYVRRTQEENRFRWEKSLQPPDVARTSLEIVKIFSGDSCHCASKIGYGGSLGGGKDKPVRPGAFPLVRSRQIEITQNGATLYTPQK
jgi:hypothetical protein